MTTAKKEKEQEGEVVEQQKKREIFICQGCEMETHKGQETATEGYCMFCERYDSNEDFKPDTILNRIHSLLNFWL
jgi:radical SAM superfamily enzyme with C-terminal helix-hairpin-helix motif